MTTLQALPYALVTLGALAVIFIIKHKRQQYPRPPGPESLPLIGSLLSMPADQEWKTYADWGAIYGPISSVSVLGQRIIIVNSHQIAVDLLDKRSAIYSDRPTLAFVSDCVGWSRAMVFRRYGPDFRTIRRLVHSDIGTPAAIRKFDRIEEDITKNPPAAKPLESA